MNRFVALLIVTAWVLAPGHGAEIDAEDIRRLNGTVEALTEGQESLRRQVRDLKEQLEKARSENSQLRQDLTSTRDMVTREQLNQVVEQLKEVDRRRSADAEYVKTQLAEIARDVDKTLAAAAKEPSKPRTPPRSSSDSGTGSSSGVALPDYMYEHTVKSGETVGAIIAAYNEEKGLKVTLAHVLAANPSLKDPRRLRTGQKLNIPEIK